MPQPSLPLTSCLLPAVPLKVERLGDNHQEVRQAACDVMLETLQVSWQTQAAMRGLAAWQLAGRWLCRVRDVTSGALEAWQHGAVIWSMLELAACSYDKLACSAD